MFSFFDFHFSKPNRRVIAQEPRLWAHLYHYYSTHVWSMDSRVKRRESTRRILKAEHGEAYSPKGKQRDGATPSPRGARKSTAIKKEEVQEEKKEESKEEEVLLKDEGSRRMTLVKSKSLPSQADFINRQVCIPISFLAFPPSLYNFPSIFPISLL